MQFALHYALEPSFAFFTPEVEHMDRGFYFRRSTAADVVAYRVKLTRQSDSAAAGSKDFAISELKAHPTDPTKSGVDLAADPAFPGLDGKYDVDVFAIDDAGNPSAPLEGVLTLDFVPPTPPTDFEAF